MKTACKPAKKRITWKMLKAKRPADRPRDNIMTRLAAQRTVKAYRRGGLYALLVPGVSDWKAAAYRLRLARKLLASNCCAIYYTR